jgi:hypothetical protein
MTIERTGWRDQALSDRHRTWGQECPAVDLDFLMCEFNRGVPVTLIDYKRYTANLAYTNGRTTDALSGFYNARGEQLPFFMTRYWPDIWAFEVWPKNLAAVAVLKKESALMTEQEFVRFLYWLRKTTLTVGDERHIARCNDLLPPSDPWGA